MVVHWLGRGRHALFQIGHYHIDTRGQSLGLAGLQRMRQPVNLRIAPRLFEPVIRCQRRYAHHRNIIKISKSFEVIGALVQVVWNLRWRGILRAIAHRIHHGLKFGHSGHQTGTASRPLKG